MNVNGGRVITAGAEVAVGGTAVAVGGTLVLVGGTLVFVGGTLVLVGGTLVLVGGTLVLVGGTLVAVGGTAVAVGDWVPQAGTEADFAVLLLVSTLTVFAVDGTPAFPSENVADVCVGVGVIIWVLPVGMKSELLGV
jgi:hypothetical protein